MERGYQELMRKAVENMTEARLDSLATVEAQREAEHNKYLKSEIEHMWRRLVGRLKHEIARVHVDSRREIRAIFDSGTSSGNDLRGRLTGSRDNHFDYPDTNTPSYEQNRVYSP